MAKKRKRKGKGSKQRAVPARNSPTQSKDPGAAQSPKGRSARPVELPLAGKPLDKKLAALLAVLSGVLWFTACADIDIWPFAWFATVPLLWVIDQVETKRQAWLFAWLAGIVANIGGFYWIAGLLERFASMPAALGVLGLVLLGAYQAVVFLLFGLALRTLRDVSRQRWGAPLPMSLLAPIIMAAFEMMVPFIFPWYLAITQAWVPPVIQIAEFTGPIGVSALLVASAGAIYDLVRETERRRRFVPPACVATIVAGSLVFGFVRMNQIDERRATATQLKIGVVQGNIAFNEKGIDLQRLAAKQLRELQDKSAELEAQGAEFIMWTESSYPYAISRAATHDGAAHDLTRIRRGFKAPIMLGAVTKDPDDRDAYPYNSALMLDADGKFTGRFDKIFLLMFGEYIPGLETFPWLRKVLPRAAGHFARGKEMTTFPLEKDGTTYLLGPMICYEDIIPAFGRELAALKPNLLVNITNDAWFGDTAEPWEHMALSVYRSVETRLDMVRAVNTGVSAFIDANGRVYAKTYAVDPAFEDRGVDGLIADVALMDGGDTFYAHYGDVFGYSCMFLTLIGWLVWPRLRRRPAREV